MSSRRTSSPSLFGALAINGLSLLLSTRLAFAMDPISVEHERAVTLFQAGRRFVEKSDCKNAVPRFLESLEHEESVGAHYNLAGCFANDGRTTLAWNHFRNAERLASAKGDVERATAAQRAASVLEAKVVRVRLRLPAAPSVDTLTVSIDGTILAQTDYALLVTGFAVSPDAPHTLEVRAPGYRPWNLRQGASHAAADLPVVTVDLGVPLPVVVPPPVSIPVVPVVIDDGNNASRGSEQRIGGAIALAVGVAGLAAGTAFGVLASTAKSDARRACDTSGAFQYPVVCDPTNRATIDDHTRTARSDATLSTIAFVGGGVLTAAGAIAWLTAPRAPPSASAHLVPFASPSSAGAVFRRSF